MEYSTGEMLASRTALAIAFVAGTLLAGGAATAQPADDLSGARKLFTEALADEDAKRFPAALEKYKRVQATRDTVAVRFRIGASLEGMGKIAKAAEAYAGAVQLGTSNGSDPDIVKAAQERVGILEPKVAHLTIRPPRGQFASAWITVDEEPVVREAVADVRVDPGPHTVDAHAHGAKPFRTEVTLAEGGRAEVPIVLEPSGPPQPEQPPATAPSSSLRTIGLVTGITGAVLLAGGVVTLVVRSSAISKLNDRCPDGNCPADQRDDLESTRDRALLAGPVAGALLVTGAAALAGGVVLYIVGGRNGAATVAPAANGAVLDVRWRF
jgi:hypothetical protein